MDLLHCKPEFDLACFSVGFSSFARRYYWNLC